MTDLWSQPGDLSESRLRTAMFCVQTMYPDAVMRDGVIYIKLVPPLWAHLMLRRWRTKKRRDVLDRCVTWVTHHCGWCPEIVVQ